MSSPMIIPKPEKVSQLLRRIVPWLLESNKNNVEYRQNYKGVRGRIGFVGGARDYAGAPYFASISAMRLGADLSFVICSKDASQAIKSYSPDLIVVPLLDCQTDTEFKKEMDCLLSRLHALVIGPGLGREKLLQDRARELISQARIKSIPLVLDADSLLLVNEDPTLIKNYPNVILTPNRIELQRMLDALYKPNKHDLRSMSTPDIVTLVRKYSRDLNVTVLAKGSSDIICEGPTQFELMTDETTGSNRRCGGQGDILSGLAGVYLHWLGQGNDSDQKVDNVTAWAAYLAAITTRKCNELTYDSLGGASLVSDMINRVHPALQSLLNASNDEENTTKVKNARYVGSLSRDEISRYTRQMIMEEFGPSRQASLKKASAVIIGAGGLGCPSAVYLAAGGIGRLGIVDDDRVESSNLHRQILHSVEKVGMLKTESIRQAVMSINPNVDVVLHSVRLNRHNAVDIVEGYDIVIDATDNLTTRYMINDACVVAKKPLISGAALKMDGQLTVYNYDEESPCFRCLFPVPPPPNAVGSCSENGVLGVIPGIIGVHQALEALKIGGGLRPAYAGKMLLFDGQLGLFRHIKLAGRKADCDACGAESKLGRDLVDYQSFCGNIKCDRERSTENLLAPEQRITVDQYKDILESRRVHILIDVRPRAQSDVSRFEHALQIPLMELVQEPQDSYSKFKAEIESGRVSEIYVVCRKGIASQRGALAVSEILKGKQVDVDVKDIIGGMTAWQRVDRAFLCI